MFVRVAASKRIRVSPGHVSGQSVTRHIYTQNAWQNIEAAIFRHAFFA